MAVFAPPLLNASRILRSSSVMMAPSTSTPPPASATIPFLLRFSRFTLFEDEEAPPSCEPDSDGSWLRTRQNSWMLLSDCSTALMKQVLPRFLSPTRFFSCCFCAATALRARLLAGRFSEDPVLSQDFERFLDERLLLTAPGFPTNSFSSLDPLSEPVLLAPSDDADAEAESESSLLRIASSFESGVSLMMKSSQA